MCDKNCKEYNGWTNYETWCVALWLGNDQDTVSYIERIARRNMIKYKLAEDLKEYVEDIREYTNPSSAGVFSDLLNSALSEVNYYEIAESYIDNYNLAEQYSESEVIE